MRAIRTTDYGGPDVLEPVEVSQPVPDEDEVLIDVQASGVNFVDIEKRRGTYPSTPEPPYIPGIEVAGTIVDTGPDVKHSVGDSVLALASNGGYAEFVTANEETLFPVPDSLSWIEAVGVPVQWFTAHNALHEWGSLSSGERVLIHAAAGGVGSAAVQLASVEDVEIYATASTAEKLQLASTLGANHTIDYTTADIAEECYQLSDGEGIDLVLDGVGGSAFTASLDALATGGRIVSYGMASGSVPTVAAPRLLFDNQSVIGYHLEDALTNMPHRVKTAVSRLTDLFSSGAVDVVVGETFLLDEAARAHEFLESRNSTGKVVLIP